MSYSTDDLDALFENGTPPPEEEIDFNQNAEEDRAQILRDIQACGYSLSRFANECYLQPSHLYDFLNGKKQLSRDRLLVVFLNLGYSYTKICRLLRRFHQPQLYPRDGRDYQILLGIQEGLSVDEIGQELEQKGFAPLCPEKSKRN